MEPTSIWALPTELYIQTIGYLSFPENAHLMIPCSHFRSLIAFDHSAQIDTETSSYARDQKLYACLICGCLLPSFRFVDDMSRRSRRRGGPRARDRFCAECDVGAGHENAAQGYAPGV